MRVDVRGNKALKETGQFICVSVSWVSTFSYHCVKLAAFHLLAGMFHILITLHLNQGSNTRRSDSDMRFLSFQFIE